jgi:predicted transcriptional regulator
MIKLNNNRGRTLKHQKKKPTGISLDDEIKSQLDAIALESHTSRSEIIRLAVLKFIRADMQLKEENSNIYTVKREKQSPKK